jgi:hypothetical protein
MIKCKECCREFKRLNVFHLRTHGLDEKTYLEKYPGADIFSEETRALISEKNDLVFRVMTERDFPVISVLLMERDPDVKMVSGDRA